MAKRGRPFKYSFKCSREHVLDAIADLYFVDELAPQPAAGYGKMSKFIGRCVRRDGGSRSKIWAKVTQIRNMYRDK